MLIRRRHYRPSFLKIKLIPRRRKQVVYIIMFLALVISVCALVWPPRSPRGIVVSGRPRERDPFHRRIGSSTGGSVPVSPVYDTKKNDGYGIILGFGELPVKSTTTTTNDINGALNVLDRNQKPVYEYADFTLFLRRLTIDEYGRILSMGGECSVVEDTVDAKQQRVCDDATMNAGSEIEKPNVVSSIQPKDVSSKTSYNHLCRLNQIECPVRWISYTSACTMSVNRFAVTLRDVGVPLKVLGMNQLDGSNYANRIRALHDHLVALPDNMLVVWTDSTNVLPTPETSVDKIIARYNELVDLYKGPRIFFAAETACYPAGGLWSFYPEPHTIRGGRGASPFRYLNAGIMVGPAGLIRRMIEIIYQHDCFDMQLMFSLAFLDPIVWWHHPQMDQIKIVPSFKRMWNPHGSTAHVVMVQSAIPDHAKPLIGVDYWNILFVVTRDVDDGVLIVNSTRNDGSEYGRLYVMDTNSFPLIVHENGDQKLNGKLIESLAKGFGYNYDAEKLAMRDENGLDTI